MQKRPSKIKAHIGIAGKPTMVTNIFCPTLIFFCFTSAIALLSPEALPPLALPSP